MTDIDRRFVPTQDPSVPRTRAVEVLPTDRPGQTSTPNTPARSSRRMPAIYVAAFRRRTATLPKPLRGRIHRCRAVLIRSRPTIAIDGRMIPAAVETIFEQARPGLWLFRSQLIEIDGRASSAEKLAVSGWARDRKEHFESPDGPRLAPVYDTLVSVLDSGREGRDYVLLSRVPVLSHTTRPTPAA